MVIQRLWEVAFVFPPSDNTIHTLGELRRSATEKVAADMGPQSFIIQGSELLLLRTLLWSKLQSCYDHGADELFSQSTSHIL
jgi:hypothetical protein